MRLPLFFVLSKTLGIMLLPTNFLIGMGVVGAILLMTRFARLGRALAVASIVLLAICAFSPLGNWLLYPLEQRFPPWDAARGAPDGIIVLGGSIDSDISAERGTPVVRSFADRIIVMARGRLIADGDARTVRNDPVVQQVYFGSGKSFKLSELKS